jgi:hypothetical protein
MTKPMASLLTHPLAAKLDARRVERGSDPNGKALVNGLNAEKLIRNIREPVARRKH